MTSIKTRKVPSRKLFSLLTNETKEQEVIELLSEIKKTQDEIDVNKCYFKSTSK